MKYVEKRFALRLDRRDGTLKLLFGVSGSPPKLDSLMQIRVARDEVVTAKMVDHPHGEEPAEAAEVVQQVPDWQLRRFGS
jgi:hypothetical protein